jgi:lipopolysaccharide/colanic/teichoic acid biosynthesis glycosyltransferase
MRRIADVVIACAMLAIALPLMFLVALVIRLDGPGPILDRISCIGRGGRRFQMLKFRTTVHDPEATLPIWADRQTTQIGDFLRYSRIECLPQLINVLRGEISIVDPDGSSPSFLD